MHALRGDAHLSAEAELAAITDTLACFSLWRVFAGHPRHHLLVARQLGKIADPIADKALTGMAFIGLSVLGELWWWVTIVILVREWVITVLRFVVIRYGVIAADELMDRIFALTQRKAGSDY